MTNNWDLYYSGIFFLGTTFLATLFFNPVMVYLVILAIMFYGWTFGVGFVVYALEGAE